MPNHDTAFAASSANLLRSRTYRLTLNATAIAASLASLPSPAVAAAQSTGPLPRQFPIGSFKGLENLPPGGLRAQLESLPAAARQRGIQWLQSVHFTESDLASLHADAEGGILYACELGVTTASTAETPAIGEASIPVNPFPTSLVFHSKPGAPNVLYINFAGETVVNSQWNTVVNRTSIPAVPFSTDADLTTYSDAEQLAIKRIWERMAEDYAPFNIDVTTERPTTLGTRVAMALITRTTDANGDPNPYSSAGGVAYVNVFGTTSYATYRPAWIYHNNLGNSEANIAEAASHEIGHNLGLSHDGKTDGTEYYGGHGSGDISWGPLMGTGYGRNVSQWSKGEYYLANNTQDDLSTIAGKLTYRTDDHGNTPGTATALALTGINIISTTPETDPANTNTANKGVLERSTDVDVFSFVTGNGPVNLGVRPWIQPAGTKGGNLDIHVSLYNETGTLLLTNNPSLQTIALIQTNLAEGRYFVHLRSTGTGNPLAANPSGYTAYGTIGQYFWNGYVTAPSNYVVRPVAELQVADITTSGQTAQQCIVTYSDDVAVAVGTLGTGDVRVTGPNGYDRTAQLVSVDNPTDGTPRVATYSVPPPSGSTWSAAANGTYAVWIQTNQVSDAQGAWVTAGQLGQFTVSLPLVLYTAGMDTDPGWTLDSPWQYGTPAYSGGPAGGFTGSKIIAYNLSGNYANNQPIRYATTPLINCSGAGSLTLRFQRWLRTRNNDAVSIQVSTNQVTWINVWSSSGAISDTGWTEMQYPLPAGVAGSPSVRLRWSLASNQSQNDIGWNIDDVEVLAGGSLDTTPPVPVLSVANLTLAGSPTHSCSVTYTDATAVRLSSLDGGDLIVTGPNNYSNAVDFVGADLPADGSPITASYSIPAPGTAWDAGDNGTYEVTLAENEVADIYNNPLPRTALGSFTVAINTNPPPTFLLSITVNNPTWGSVTPASGSYLGGSALELAATAEAYFDFERWTGDVASTNNPLSLVLQTNLTLEAVFREMLTLTNSTPHWWLAAHGYTNDFETAVLSTGANGMALWQSYVAGLNPNDPQSQLRLTGSPGAGGTFVLDWSGVTGRVYTVWASADLLSGFAPLSGAVDLPSTVQSYTNANSTANAQFYRLQVKLQP